MTSQHADTPPLDVADNCVLAVHGGAGVISRELTHNDEHEIECRAALEAALTAGYSVLKSGATSLDAVTAAVKSLEDSPCFNAGKGAAYTRQGHFELDAAIMDGATRRAGAVAGLTTVKNPIAAARLVMERSPHVLLAGPAADAFAQQHGAQIVARDYFHTELRWMLLQEFLRKPGDAADLHAESRFGTVGCVALDSHGNLAAGTSTGGVTGKLPGRIGDSPNIGAGTFADNATCAISATGDGEYFIRAVAAYDIAALIAYKGLNIVEAARIVIHEKIRPAGGEGGVIALNRRGNLAMTYSSEGMYRGYVARDGRTRVMIYRDK